MKKKLNEFRALSHDNELLSGIFSLSRSQMAK